MKDNSEACSMGSGIKEMPRGANLCCNLVWRVRLAIAVHICSETKPSQQQSDQRHLFSTKKRDFGTPGHTPGHTHTYITSYLYERIALVYQVSPVRS